MQQLAYNREKDKYMHIGSRVAFLAKPSFKIKYSFSISIQFAKDAPGCLSELFHSVLQSEVPQTKIPITVLLHSNLLWFLSNHGHVHKTLL